MPSKSPRKNAALRFLVRAFLWHAVLLSGQAVAQPPVAHEFVPNVDPNEAHKVLSTSEADPDAIVYGDEILQAPTRAEAAAPPMVATPGDSARDELPGQRSPTFVPDRLTQLEGTLDYYAAFTPSIAPFKRVSSLDATLLGSDGRTPILGIRNSKRRAIKIEGADSAPPDARPRDRFWGEVTLDFSRGRVVPMPSVSPESRILSLRSDPPVSLAIERDDAGNFFAVLRGALPEQPVFAAFLTDAPRSYFAASIPNAPVASLKAHVPALDRGIAARALRFAAELGIGPDSDLRAALSALTRHFRSFRESPQPPSDSGDVYLDLARAKKGICRHRAYAFVVTAHALGIPAHFVQNEAHSWVEVELPRVGFMRIDLGGAAHGLTAHGASDRPQYHASAPDPLPRPTAYEESYSLLGASATGLRRPTLQELEGRWVAPAADSVTAQSSFATGPSDRVSDTSGRTPLTIALIEREPSVLRGQAVHLAGHVRDAAGRGVAGLRIEVSLAEDGRSERMLLGTTETTAQGAFESDFEVPADLTAGDYQLLVVTPGSEKYLPAAAP